MTMIWDGVTKASTLKPAFARLRHQLCDAAKSYDFAAVFTVLDDAPPLINTWRPDGSAWFTPLHQAAFGGMNEGIAAELVRRGAWLTLPTASGDLAVDLARQRGHLHLIEPLTPNNRREVETQDLELLAAHLHRVIMGRAESLVHREALRLPLLTPLLEAPEPTMWFPVPGMYGGFKIHLHTVPTPQLTVESWSRVADGSGRRHQVTTTGWELVDKGFV